MSRKPEIRYKDDLISNDLPDLQYRILCEMCIRDSLKAADFNLDGEADNRDLVLISRQKN